MERFRELYVDIDDETALINDLAETLEPLWVRDEEREKEVRTLPSQVMYCFRRVRTDGLDAQLWLTRDSNNRLRVTNIVPLKVNQLKMEDYNALLLEFADQANLAQKVKNAGGTLEITEAKYSLDDIVDVDTARSLRLFSSAANKSTGYSHPCDMERWLAFITSAFRSDRNLSSDDLEKFLIEDGWSFEIAIDLACQFEYSLQLLEAYEGA